MVGLALPSAANGAPNTANGTNGVVKTGNGFSTPGPDSKDGQDSKSNAAATSADAAVQQGLPLPVLQ